MEVVDRDRVRQLVAAPDAVLVEVLPRSDYDWAHLPEAIHVPLAGWDASELARRWHPDTTVVCYCNDFL